MLSHFLVKGLFENQFEPKRRGYSSFSEKIFLIKTTLAIDISAVDLNKLLYDEYVTADNHLLKSHLREIISFEKLPDEVVFYSEVLYLDERLYTFNQNISFDEFKARYDFGQES